MNGDCIVNRNSLHGCQKSKPSLLLIYLISVLGLRAVMCSGFRLNCYCFLTAYTSSSAVIAGPWGHLNRETEIEWAAGETIAPACDQKRCNISSGWTRTEGRMPWPGSCLLHCVAKQSSGILVQVAVEAGGTAGDCDKGFPLESHGNSKFWSLMDHMCEWRKFCEEGKIVF